MPNWLRLENVRHTVQQILDPGEQATALVATRGVTAWEGPAPGGTTTVTAPHRERAEAGALAHDASAGAQLAAAVGTDGPRLTCFLLVTDRRLLALRKRGRGPAMAFDPVFGIALPELVSVDPLAPPWHAVFDRSWRARLAFRDASSAVVEVGPQGNIPLLAGTLAGGARQ